MTSAIIIAESEVETYQPVRLAGDAAGLASEAKTDSRGQVPVRGAVAGLGLLGGGGEARGWSVTITGFGLWSVAAPVTASTPMPTTPPSSRFPAKPAAPVAGISLVNCTTWGSNPGFWMVMEILALRLATTAQGVMQVIGASSPEMMASAPEGVDETLMVSVVPRATDAQPPSTAQAAKTPKTRIFLSPQPRRQ
jgi:hypothetical protein